VALRRETNSIGHRAIAVIGQRQQGRPTPASSVFSNALRFIKQFGATSFSTDGVKKCERGERFPNQYVPFAASPRRKRNIDSQSNSYSIRFSSNSAFDL